MFSTSIESVPDTEWLRDAIRASFSASSDSVSSSSGEAPPQRDPRFAKLIEGLLWSKRFVLTYQLVVAGFVIVVASVHWYSKFIRWQARRLRSRSSHAVQYKSRPTTAAALEEEDGNSSSGSSTLLGFETPQKTPEELTPLLPASSMIHHPQPSAVSRVKAGLMYQPRPLPIVHKILPSNGTTICILIFTAVQVFYTVYHINFTWFELFVFADRAGLIFAMNLPLLYLLAAKTSVLRILTGYSYESLNIFHRRLGEIMCFAALLHTLGMIGVWFTLFRPRGVSLIAFMLEKICLTGLGAFLSYEMLYFTSLSSFRRRWYELFLGLHVFLQIAAMAFLWFHHHATRPYVGIALGIFLVDRVVYRIGVKSKLLVADTVIMEDLETVRLSVTVEIQGQNMFTALFGRAVNRSWQATDHVFLTCPAMSKKHGIQAHPFTIASAAPSPETGLTKLELIVRAQDGFSADLVKEAAIRPQLKVRIDGPYGSAHARVLLGNSDVAILVAGGSGIAVCWPLVHYLLDTNAVDAEQRPVRRKQKVILIWVIHKASHLSWLGMEGLSEVERKGVEVIIPPATAEAGRPDLETYIENIVEKVGANQKIGIVGSGPDSMGRSVRNTASRLVREGRRADVMIEKFGW